jgi:hypothetical protein
MTSTKTYLIGLIAALGVSVYVAPAFAQEAPPTSPTVINFPVTGFVNRLCAIGAISGGNGTFAVGNLIDGTTGFLSTTLSAPSKTVTGSFCNAPSTVAISATPLTATGFVGAAPSGFTSTVDYVATAAGWSPTSASFGTGAATNTAALQPATSANAGTITVSIGTFASRGGVGVRPVAATAYNGQVTVTLAVAP